MEDRKRLLVRGLGPGVRPDDLLALVRERTGCEVDLRCIYFVPGRDGAAVVTPRNAAESQRILAELHCLEWNRSVIRVEYAKLEKCARTADPAAAAAAETADSAELQQCLSPSVASSRKRNSMPPRPPKAQRQFEFNTSEPVRLERLATHPDFKDGSPVKARLVKFVTRLDFIWERGWEEADVDTSRLEGLLNSAGSQAGPLLPHPNPAEVCLVRREGKFQRGVIRLPGAAESCLVELVDTCEQVHVRHADILCLPTEAADFPPVRFHGALTHIEPCPEAAGVGDGEALDDVIGCFLQSNAVRIQVLRQIGTYCDVEIHSDEGKVSDIVVREKLALSPVGGMRGRTPAIEMILPPRDLALDAGVVFVESPDSFFVQLLNPEYCPNVAFVEGTVGQSQPDTGRSHSNYVPYPGEAVCCRHEGITYRGNVLALLAGSSVHVFLVDYGEVLVVPRPDVRPLPDWMLVNNGMRVKGQALQCALPGLPRELSDECVSATKELLPVYARLQLRMLAINRRCRKVYVDCTVIGGLEDAGSHGGNLRQILLSRSLIPPADDAPTAPPPNSDALLVPVCQDSPPRRSPNAAAAAAAPVKYQPAVDVGAIEADVASPSPKLSFPKPRRPSSRASNVTSTVGEAEGPKLIFPPRPSSRASQVTSTTNGLPSYPRSNASSSSDTIRDAEIDNLREQLQSANTRVSLTERKLAALETENSRLSNRVLELETFVQLINERSNELLPH